MRISCNGCRVLRKCCTRDCTLRSCLHWLTSPESQSNATLFLAKFYGRTGLINLISAAPARLRPEIFKSLLFEACGRIINPVHGSVGLMTSGDWPRCHAAVAAVLSGGRLMKQASGDDDSSTADLFGSFQSSNIRRIAKRSPHRDRTRSRRKRSHSEASAEFPIDLDAKFTLTGWGCGGDSKVFVIDQENVRAPNHYSVSVETVEPSLMQYDEGGGAEPETRPSEVGLELTLGLNPLYNYLSAPIEISDSEE